MKLFTGWVMSAGLVLAATSANAQIVAPTEATAALFGRFRCRRPLCGDAAGSAPAGYGPRLLPAPEVYTVLRDNGFSPLGVPQQRGFVYTIAVIDRGGDDGPAGDRCPRRADRPFRAGLSDGDAADGLRPRSDRCRRSAAVRGPPRPPASVPHVASRTPAVPLPKAMPQRAGEPRRLAAKTATSEGGSAKPRQTCRTGAAIGGAGKPAAATPPRPAAVIEAKPTPAQIQPTKEMPKVQGLE